MKQRIKNWLEFLEVALLIFFVMMDAVALMVLVAPNEGSTATIIVFVAASLLSLVLSINYVAHTRKWW